MHGLFNDVLAMGNITQVQHRYASCAWLCVQVPDPPLLRLETEASHAYLSLLLHIASSSSSSAGSTSTSSSLRWPGAAEAQQATQVGMRGGEMTER